MVNTLPPVSMNLTISDSLRENKTRMSRLHQELEESLSSGGHCEYLYEGTPNVTTALSADRRIMENQVHHNNSVNLSNRAQSEIEFVKLCVETSRQLGVKLSEMKTDSGEVDQTFLNWCSQKLTEITRIANKTTFQSEYALSASHPGVAPVDLITMTTPMPITGVPDLLYSRGGFEKMVFQLNAREQTSMGVSIIHPGIENLTRTLRMCMNGNVMNKRDPVWDAATDLLNGSAVPQLSYALKEAGELKAAADKSVETVKTENLTMSAAYQNSAFRDMEQILSESIEAKGLVDIQESLFTSTHLSTRKFSDKLEQLF